MFTGYIKFEYYTTIKRVYITVTYFFTEFSLIYLPFCKTDMFIYNADEALVPVASGLTLTFSLQQQFSLED